MVTRRVAAFGVVAACFGGSAFAQIALLSATTRQSILDAKALAENDAARYRAYAPLFGRAARDVARADPVLSDALAQVGTLFARASGALTDGARSIPQPLPAAAPDIAPQGGPSQLPPLASVRRGPATPAPTPPATTVRITPTQRLPSLEAGVGLITPEPRSLTRGVIYNETNAGALAWRRIADGFRGIAERTGVAVGVSATHFETASRTLDDARLQLLRARFSESDLEAGDRLGNFEIQDLLRRANQNETLASSVQRKLDDTATSIVRHIAG